MRTRSQKRSWKSEESKYRRERSVNGAHIVVLHHNSAIVETCRYYSCNPRVVQLIYRICNFACSILNLATQFTMSDCWERKGLK